MLDVTDQFKIILCRSWKSLCIIIFQCDLTWQWVEGFWWIKQKEMNGFSIIVIMLHDPVKYRKTSSVDNFRRKPSPSGESNFLLPIKHLMCLCMPFSINLTNEIVVNIGQKITRSMMSLFSENGCVTALLSIAGKTQGFLPWFRIKFKWGQIFLHNHERHLRVLYKDIWVFRDSAPGRYQLIFFWHKQKNERYVLITKYFAASFLLPK